MKTTRKPQKASRKATKSRIVKIATGTAVHEFATPGHKSGDRFFIAGLSKAAKVYRNPDTGRVPRPGEAVKISVKPGVKYRRASATSDEVFANLAEAFSSL